MLKRLLRVALPMFMFLGVTSTKASASVCHLTTGQFYLATLSADAKQRVDKVVSMRLKSDEGCAKVERIDASCESLACSKKPSSLGRKGAIYSYRFAQVGARFVLDLYRSTHGESLKILSRWQGSTIDQAIALVSRGKGAAVTAETTPSQKTAVHTASIGFQVSQKGVGFHFQALDFRFPNRFRVVGINFGFQGDFGAMLTTVNSLSDDDRSFGKLDRGAYTMVIGLGGLGFGYRVKSLVLRGTVYPIGVMTFWRNDEIVLPESSAFSAPGTIEELYSYRRYFTLGFVPVELGLDWEFKERWFVSTSVTFPILTLVYNNATSPHADDESIVNPVGSIRLGVKF